MIDEFTFELRCARRKSGLTQADCSHLINVSENRISKLERGEAMPSLREMLSLSVLFGRTFECLFDPMMTDARRQIMSRIETLPDVAPKNPNALRRGRTLETLVHRLLVENQAEYGG